MKYLLIRRQAILPLVIGVGYIFLSACAGIVSKHNTIEERATGRWNTLLSDDLAGAYEYLSPGFRSSVSSVQYQRSLLLNRIRWTGASFAGSECAEMTCKVTISLSYTVYGALPGVSSYKSTDAIYESWIKDAGIWYYVPTK